MPLANPSGYFNSIREEINLYTKEQIDVNRDFPYN